MGVELDFLGTGAVGGIQNGTGLLDGFENRGRSGGAGGILEGQAVKRNAGSDDFVQAVNVEFGGMGIGLVQRGSQTHHGHGDLMLQAVLGNGAAGDIQVADVVQSVKVTDGGDAVLLEKFGMEVDDIAGLAGETNHVHAAGEGLEVDFRTDGFPPEIHHFEGIFLAIEIESLKTGTAADFQMIDPGIHRRLESGQKIFGLDAGTEAGLESVTERTVHEFDFFHFFATPLYYLNFG